MKPKYSQNKKNHTLLAAGLLTASFVVTPSVQASDWTGASANWSSNANPGWNGTGVPNAVGAVANYGGSASVTTTQDVAGVTVGTISWTGSGDRNWSITLTNGITLNQDGAGSGRATISNTNATAASSNGLNFASGTLTLADNLLISNTGASTRTSGSIVFAATSVIAGTGNITIDNVLNGGAGAIVIAGTNTFTGNVNVRSGRTIVQGSSVFGANANQITLGAEDAGDASLFFSAGINNQNYTWVVASGSGGTLTLGSESTNGSSVTLGSFTLNDNIVFNRGSASNSTNVQAVNGTGGITKTGAGIFKIGSSGNYSGNTTVSAGILRISSATAMQNSALDTSASVAGDATNGLQIDSGTSITAITLGGLIGDKDLKSTAGGVFTTASNRYSSITGLTLNPGTGVTRTYSGAITNGANNMSLTKTGLGTQVLSGTNTYTGATNVNAGTLVVNGSISTSTTTVQSGATLGGSGTVGGLTVNSGAFHTPGSSAGIQNTGNYSNAGTLAIEINGATVGTVYDQVNTTGTVSLSGVLSITMGYTPADNALFFILANDGVDAISGTFSNASVNGDTYTLGGQDFAISYFGDSATNSFTGGNDVVLRAVVIPEPRAALLCSLGMLMLLRRRR